MFFISFSFFKFSDIQGLFRWLCPHLLVSSTLKVGSFTWINYRKSKGTNFYTFLKCLTWVFFLQFSIYKQNQKWQKFQRRVVSVKVPMSFSPFQEMKDAERLDKLSDIGWLLESNPISKPFKASLLQMHIDKQTQNATEICSGNWHYWITLPEECWNGGPK